jgi:hypothetical protein
VAPLQANKKTDMANHLEAINRVGLLVNEPPAVAGCSSASHPKFADDPFV